MRKLQHVAISPLIYSFVILIQVFRVFYKSFCYRRLFFYGAQLGYKMLRRFKFSCAKEKIKNAYLLEKKKKEEPLHTVLSHFQI